MTDSIEFRRKALSIKEREHLSFEAAAQRFGVGKMRMFRWSKQIEARTTRNQPATKIDMEALKRDVEQYPDAYQSERAKRLEVSQRGIGYALKRLGISRKKTFSPPKAEVVKREHLVKQIETYPNDGRNLVYIDESGFANDMPCRPGYAPIGTCCLGQPNWHARGRPNVIAALLALSLLTVNLFTDAINTHTFYA